MKPFSPLPAAAMLPPQPANGSPAEASHPNKPPQPIAERDAKGRFTKGNPGGPGNPFARQVAKLRAALVNKVTETDMERIAEDLLVKARLGDLAAIKLLFLYVLGKPAQTVNPDTLDIDEWQQTIQPLPQIIQELPAAMMTMPVAKMSGMVRIMQPLVQDKCAQIIASPAKEREGNPAPSEEKNPPRQDNARTESAPSEPPSPSANGGNGRKKTEGEPSANGGDGRVKRLSSWLAEIAARMPPSANGGKGHRQGRKKR